MPSELMASPPESPPIRAAAPARSKIDRGVEAAGSLLAFMHNTLANQPFPWRSSQTADQYLRMESEGDED